MKNNLLNCWEILECGREKGGHQESEFGECVVSKEDMGHSCWAVAGTFCLGEVQGSVAQKLGYCSSCDVHRLYNRSTGSKGNEIRAHHPDEESRYLAIMLDRAEKKRQ